jgi:hypothetical protein
MFAKPNAQAALRASLGTMKGVVTNEAPTSGKEQVCIVLMQTGKHIESSTINFDEDRSRKVKLMEELDPMRAMIVGHGILSYFRTPLPPCFYTTHSLTDELLWRRQNDEEKGERT